MCYNNHSILLLTQKPTDNMSSNISFQIVKLNLRDPQIKRLVKAVKN